MNCFECSFLTALRDFASFVRFLLSHFRMHIEERSMNLTKPHSSIRFSFSEKNRIGVHFVIDLNEFSQFCSHWKSMHRFFYGKYKIHNENNYQMINMDVGWCIMLPDNWIVIEYVLLHLSYIPLLPRQVAKKLTDDPGIILMSFFYLVNNAHLFLFIWYYYPISALSLFRGMKWIEMDYHKPKYWNEICTDFSSIFYAHTNYMLNVEWRKGKIDMPSIIFDVYVHICIHFFSSILDWLCFLSIFTKPFPISTYSFSYTFIEY